MRREDQYLGQAEEINLIKKQQQEYLIFALVGIFICLSFYGCGQIHHDQQAVGQEDNKKINRAYNKPTSQQPDPYRVQQPIKYFGKASSYPLHQLPEYEYPDFSKDIHGKEGLKRALKQSMIYYGKVPPSTMFYFGEDKYDARHMLLSVEKFLAFLEKEPSSRDIRSFLHKNYRVYTTVRKPPQQDQKGDSYKNASTAQLNTETSQASEETDLSVLFTGYYEPSLKGSLVKEGEYIYPIYSKPDDLIEVPRGGFSGKYKGTPASGARRINKNKLVPYYTRSEINRLKGYEKHAKPLVWVNNRIDRFFLEIQGSGRVELKQGGTLRVQYHTKNGRPYRSIGRYLIDKGEIAKEDVSMQSIRKWLEDNPSRVDEVLNHNPSFVFFREGNSGPVGCLGVEVTQMRTIATDTSTFPKGALCFMETTVPSWNSREDNIAWQNHSVFVLNQDTGGAIKGPGRADYFCGNGHYAEIAAGYMKQTGRLYFLALKK